MQVGRYYKLNHFLPWTKTKIYLMLVLSSIPPVLYHFFDCKWVAIPWVPVALVGTAAAFITGFRNTQTYNRLWEARQIWGGIVNASRTWGTMVLGFVRITDKTREQQWQQQLVYRHIAWLTALRFQMRESRTWENVKTRSYNTDYLNYYKVPEWESDLGTELGRYLTDAETAAILAKKNRAAQLLAWQSQQLRELNGQGYVSDLNYVSIQNQIKELFDLQGRSERIKNFPYPRQFSSINLYFAYLLVILLPMGLLGEFAKLGPSFVWLTIPCSVVVGWVFLTLEQIGESTENPFEGSANDVPITSMCRTIEIDLRDMLDEKELPAAITPVNDILM